MLQSNFSPSVTVLSYVCTFLPPKAVCHARQTSVICNKNLHPFKAFAELNGAITCGQMTCSAMRKPSFIEHCPVCEKNVCVDHLERCNNCFIIVCDDCNGFCCPNN